MNTSSVRYWLLLIGLLGAGYASFVVWRWGSPKPLGGAVAVVGPSTSPPAVSSTPVADFVLIDSEGQEFDSKSLRGKVWVASFFFTNCPSACWRMNQALSAFQQTHPDSAARFVSITCDPDNDTPEALAKYAEHFKADPDRWTFLTGDMRQIESIGQDSFKMAVVQKVHSDRACVVDREGQIRGRFRLTEPDQVELLERLLAVVEAEEADRDLRPAPPDDQTPVSDAADDEAAAAPTSAPS